MATMFRLLGAVEADLDGQVLDLGPARQRSVLVALLVDVNHVVPLDELIERVWGDRRPRRVRETLYSYLSRLRTVLARAGGVQLSRHHGGYRLQADVSTVDLHRFRRQVADARQTSSDDRVAIALGDALDLWHGEAFATIESPWLNHLRTTLDAERRAAELEYADVMLRLGRHAELLADLVAATTNRPLDERLASQQMLALYRAGRQADALSVYRQIRDVLADQLGVDPGQDLERLHQQILTADPDLVGPDPVAGSSRTGSLSIPAQLPAATAWFTGRSIEVSRILANRGRGETSKGAVISAIDGMAGIGKTALAVHAAHRLADSFPHGQLFLDLHGFTDDVEPVEPGAALEVVLRALGEPGALIPPTVDERAALYRTRLADKQMLIVLDNAHNEAQVLPLLPGSAGCMVLITSRRRLTGLDSADAISLDVLSSPDAVSLFIDATGSERISDDDRNVIERIVQLCGQLPLAIRIAAARLRHRPAMTAMELADLLGDQQDRLAELHAGQRSATAAFQLSYAELTDDLRRFFRILSLHPGTDFDRCAAAALADTNLQDAGVRLDSLLDTHLLIQLAPGRYRFHDLLRAYATRCTAHEDTEAERRACMSRLLEFHLNTVTGAVNHLYPFDIDQKVRPQPTAIPGLVFDAASSASKWLDVEHANLLAGATLAASHVWVDHVIGISTSLRRHLRVRCRFSDAQSLHSLARTAARDAGDSRGELTALCALGDIHRAQNRYGQAATCYQTALIIARDIGDPTAELDTMRGLGLIHYMQNRFRDADDCFEQAFTIARQAGHRNGELATLHTLGDVHRAQGKYVLAGDFYQQALTIARDLGNRGGEVHALRGLGDVHNAQGRHELATEDLEHALAIARDIGHPYGELIVLCRLGDAHRAQDQYQPAMDCYEQALTIARDLDDRNGQFEAIQGIAHAHRVSGHLRQAVISHQQALDLAIELGQGGYQARAHNGLAEAEHARGNTDHAHHHWRSALELLTSIGTDQADDVHIDNIRTRIGSLDHSRAAR